MITDIIKLALLEDLGENGDITSLACVADSRFSHAQVIAKQTGIIAGIEYFSAVYEEIDPDLNIMFLVNDGYSVEKGDTIIELEGNSRSILAGERTALNFLGHLSGVATATHRLASLIEGTDVILLDTRKTLPGLRMAEKEAVESGGGANHRFGLYDMMLIKENHIAAAGGITAALKRTHDYKLANDLDVIIEIEVKSLDELKEAIAGNPDRIMLDNFTPGYVEMAVAFVKGRVELEVSGGINERNIRRYAEAGPDFISVGGITASAPALDLSMLIEV